MRAERTSPANAAESRRVGPNMGATNGHAAPMLRLICRPWSPARSSHAAAAQPQEVFLRLPIQVYEGGNI